VGEIGRCEDMKIETIKDTADNYINGNISYTKKMVKKMSKRNLLDFLLCFESIYYSDGKGDGGHDSFRRAFITVKYLLED
jgi:hypothetical protein